MPKKKPLPTVRMEPVFARDHQRRLRLVIDLLEQEARRQQQSSPETKLETLRAFIAAQTSLGGNR
ncbi:MAG TPA: hypothetical protein VFD58_04310 [Blastocatellia bacterium]|nr:hypothetical protein [Blastocatellia bacterium]